MLPAFIIEEIRKREMERARRDERPRVEVPLDPPGSPMPSDPPSPVVDDGDREDPSDTGDGCVVIDL